MDFPGDAVTQDVIHAIATYRTEQDLHRTASAFYRLAYGDTRIHTSGLVQTCKEQVGRDVELFVWGFLGGREHIPKSQKPPF